MSFVVPDACTLPTAQRPLRLAEFDGLFISAVSEVDQIDATHARLRLDGPVGLASTLQDLIARETECCSFFTFTATLVPVADGETVFLDIEVPAVHADVLVSLIHRASTVSGGETS